MESYVEKGGFGELYHYRRLLPLDEQTEAASNRDTLYSIGFFDLTEPVTITKPDTGDRYQSMVVINEDQYLKMVEYEPGEYTLTQAEIGTQYAGVLVRTFVDPNDPDDVETVNGLQDEIAVSQDSVGTFEIPKLGPPIVRRTLRGPRHGWKNDGGLPRRLWRRRRSRPREVLTR